MDTNVAPENIDYRTTRTSVREYNQGLQELIAVCRMARPILIDSVTYINFVAEKLIAEGWNEVYPEARIVLTDDINNVVETIDVALANQQGEY